MEVPVTYEAPVTANAAGMISTVVCPSITLTACVKTLEYMYNSDTFVAG